MIDTVSSDALALRATASGFDAVRSNLPVIGDSQRSLDGVTVARQLSDLGTLITDLADEVLHRAAEQNRDGHTPPAIVGFAAAVRPACEAASALGAVAHRLSVLHQSGHLHQEPGAQQVDRLVMGNPLGAADNALRETADSLRASAAAISLPSVRTQAARSRSTTAAASPAPPSATAPAADPPGRIARGR